MIHGDGETLRKFVRMETEVVGLMKMYHGK